MAYAAVIVFIINLIKKKKIMTEAGRNIGHVLE
jgi:hypothetical protein